MTVVDADGNQSISFETRILNLAEASAQHHGISVDDSKRIMNGETVVIGQD